MHSGGKTKKEKSDQNICPAKTQKACNCMTLVVYSGVKRTKLSQISKASAANRITTMTTNKDKNYPASSASFSPGFDKVAAYGTSEQPKHHHDPYGKRADPSRPAHTLSPEINVSNIAAITKTNSKNLLNSKKEKSMQSLLASLPISLNRHRSYTLRVKNSGNTICSNSKNDDRKRALITTIEVFKGKTEESVASFTVKEKSGQTHFPWSLVDNDTGLEVALGKVKSSQVPHDLQQQDAKRCKRLELYGRTPLFENQRHKKKGNKQTIYPWACIRQRHASKLLGLFPIAESIEMTTKHKSKIEYKVYRTSTNLKVNEIKAPIGLKTKSAMLEQTDDEGIFKLVVEPRVDPLLMIAFLAATKQLLPSTSS
eukprot:scaffold1949_cov119-Cylindrotheca_fusiformis.AAC.11